MNIQPTRLRRSGPPQKIGSRIDMHNYYLPIRVSSNHERLNIIRRLVNDEIDATELLVEFNYYMTNNAKIRIAKARQLKKNNISKLTLTYLK